MSYPAADAFASDPDVTFARWKVWNALQPPFLSHAVAKDVKIETVRRLARVSPSTASESLNWLIERGYVVVHSRDRRGMPSMTLAYAWVSPADYPERTISANGSGR